MLPTRRKVQSNLEKLEQADTSGILEALRASWRLVTPFFCGRETWCKAWTLLILMQTGAFVGAFCISRAATDIGNMGNSLVTRNEAAFEQDRMDLMVTFIMLQPTGAITTIFAQSFAVEWRRYTGTWLFERYVSEKQVFYQLTTRDNDIDNPDQRMSQDIGEFCSSIMRLAEACSHAFARTLTLSVLLFQMDPSAFALFISLAVGVTVFMVFVLGRQLMKLDRLVLAQEAFVRFELVRVREYAEPVAFYKGQDYELTRVNDTFATAVWFHYRRLIVFTFFLVFQHVLKVYPSMLPHFLMGSRIMVGSLPIGTLSSLQFIFTDLFEHFIVLAKDLDVIARAGAQAIRVDQVKKVIAWMDEGKDVNGNLVLSSISLTEHTEGLTTKGGVLQLDDVTLRPPNFPHPTVSDLNFVLHPGESMLLCGASGIGKSSLLRTIAGLWAAGQGDISRVDAEYCFFVPQEPYITLGTLRENLRYPRIETEPTEESTREIYEALETVNLAEIGLRQGLDKPVDLAAMLSGGEKQRLSFSRILLQTNLKLAILDESTSALDIRSENRMYGLMAKRVNCFVSVGHRENLVRFHTHRLLLERADDLHGALGTFSKLPETCFNNLMKKRRASLRRLRDRPDP